jgi:hypothetical protein
VPCNSIIEDKAVARINGSMFEFSSPHNNNVGGSKFERMRAVSLYENRSL